jgi:hypothetical protein
MPIYTFADAKSQLKQRVGNRGDITDVALGKFINQAQHVIATNVKGIEAFDQTIFPLPLTINNYIYSINGGGGSGGPSLVLNRFWAMNDISLNQPYVQKMNRGEYEQLIRMRTIPKGYPTQWSRRGLTLIFFSLPHTTMSILVRYRSTPTIDVLEIPDEWFEHLINLACTFVYPTIGRNKDRDDLFAKMPQNLQLAVLNPLTPSMWESAEDPGMSFYAKT